MQVPENQSLPAHREWIVSVSPHVKSNETVAKIMWTVVACLMPPLFLSVFIFGFQVLIITAVSVVSCVAVEYVSQKSLGRPVTITDGSAVLTGVLLAFLIPPGVSYLLPVLGAVMAIYIAKHLFGGIGFNIFNPALMGRAFLLATFPVAMTSAWLPPVEGLAIFSYFGAGVDAVSTATPLAVMKEQGMVAFTEMFGSGASLYTSFFLGWRPGCIGETSGFLLVLGGAYLIYKNYITWHTPVAVLGTIATLTWIFGGESYFGGDPLLAILSGGAILGSIYMATDYVTSPTTKTGQLVYGVGIGALTVLIRLKGGYPEGICYAILLMNPLASVIDNFCKPKRFAGPAGGDK
ncbi:MULTISPECIES: RnfABCDGE type electron transport complex subunit D [Desulfosediminicola]|uniref:RnfABCDGE type electron transport complex subunit D n=1 Tax=Desulfosediminicola TaxID=2886823 RepID=UPI0010ACFE8F|nr:RnfABCDGE type electron transport complex subunit D [Desulfosediminicola ganghwensis]